MMTVSRRAYLMGKPSAAIMRAAGRAASSETIRAAAQDEAHRRLREILVETGQRPPVVLPPVLYDRLAKDGADMRGYARSQPIPLH